MSAEKEKLINDLLNDTPILKKHLKNNRYMSIGATIYKATAQLSSIRGGKGNRHYFISFVEVGKDFVKDVETLQLVKEIYQKYNYDYEYPVPCNIKEDYEFVVDGVIWNSYKCPSTNYITVKGDVDLEAKCPKTMQLFRHIYRDSLQLAIDFMTVEFMFPTHPLPAQILYSRENNTGKTTILLHRKAVYGKNATIIDSGTFEDKFNAPIAFKNFIGIDEGKLKGDGSLEKFKALVTNPTIQHRAMRKSAVEVPNFGKWALATNKDNFAKLDLEDSRFWVIKVPKLQTKYEPNFMNKLKAEVPYWTGFLKKRWENRFNGKGMFHMQTPEPLSRLWFAEDQYSTSELAKMKRASRSMASKDFLDDIIEWFDKYNDKHFDTRKYEFCANIKQLKEQFYNFNQKITTTVLKNILERDLNLVILKTKDGRTLNHSYTDVFDNNAFGNNKIRRRNVYKFDYFELTMLRDGDDIKADTLGDATSEQDLPF